MGLWGAFMEAIPAYTGLSPVTFFTLLAVLVGVYHLVSGLFVSPPVERSSAPMQPIAPPVQLGDVTEEELRAYDGSDPKKPLLMAVKGQIYDVSHSRMFYGPGGPYALFAGKDASRALAKMSFEEKDLTSDIEGLSPSELEALQDWEYKFMGKYVKVGQIITRSSTREVEVTGATSNNAAEAENNVSEQKAREGAVEAELVRETKENGVVPKEDAVETRENPTDSEEPKENALEINENIEGASELKKTEDVAHQHNHAHEHNYNAGVAAE